MGIHLALYLSPVTVTLVFLFLTDRFVYARASSGGTFTDNCAWGLVPSYCNTSQFITDVPFHNLNYRNILFLTNNDGPSGSSMHISCSPEAACNLYSGVNTKTWMCFSWSISLLVAAQWSSNNRILPYLHGVIPSNHSCHWQNILNFGLGYIHTDSYLNCLSNVSAHEKCHNLSLLSKLQNSSTVCHSLYLFPTWHVSLWVQMFYKV